jgi:hypothetical protein
LVLGFLLQQLPLQIVVLISVSRQGKAGLGYPLSITLKLSFAEITLHLGIGGGRQESQHRWRRFRLACFDGCFDIYDVRFNRHDTALKSWAPNQLDQRRAFSQSCRNRYWRICLLWSAEAWISSPRSSRRSTQLAIRNEMPISARNVVPGEQELRSLAKAPRASSPRSQRLNTRDHLKVRQRTTHLRHRPRTTTDDGR